MTEKSENKSPPRVHAQKNARGLGRGLSTLIGDSIIRNVTADYPPPADRGASSQGSADLKADIQVLGIDQLHSGSTQPRRRFDEKNLQELAASLKKQGILQPILVRPILKGDAKSGTDGQDQYEIIAGERRWRAAQRAQIHQIPVIIRNLSDRDALEVSIIENIQRTDLNPMEEAHAFRRLLDEFSYTQEQLAVSLGKSRSHIANTLRLCHATPRVQDLLIAGALSAGHARTLLGFAKADEVADEILAKGLSVRAVEKIVADFSTTNNTRKSDNKSDKKEQKNADTRALEKTLSDGLGLGVAIDDRGKQGGSIRVLYKTLEQLDDIVRRLS